MADSLRASQQGLEIINRARYKKGWKKQVTVAWWETANTSQATLKRFWLKKPIDRQAFMGICEAVGVNWETVVDMEAELVSPTETSAGSGEGDQTYVERPPIESLCYQTLTQPGSLVRIKGLRQMGKTWLLTNTLERLAKESYRTVHLSLKLAQKSHLSDLDKFLRWLSLMVTRELNLPSQIDEYWEEAEIGSKANCTTYWEEYLLAAANAPLILGLDDVDLIFSDREIYEDFFGLLRFWHERAKSRQLWKQLRLVVSYSTEVYLPLNIQQSPFNVGVPIELPEFSLEQVQTLAKLHQLDLNIEQIESLMIMVCGHPYLLELAFNYLHSHQNNNLTTVLGTAATEAGIYGNHLHQHLFKLLQEPDLASAFQRVVTTNTSVQLEPLQAYQLNRLGLIKLSGNQAQPRCLLYRQYFANYWQNV